MKRSREIDLVRLNEFPSYKGGCTMLYGNYIYEFCPGHHLQNGWGWAAQHRMIAEEKLGRNLRLFGYSDQTETVHHKDENPLNNDPDNLEIMRRIDHIRLHARQRAEKLKSRITEGMARRALEKTGNLRLAAIQLKCHTMTLRNRFPDLVAPLCRKSYCNDPYLVERVRAFAETNISRKRVSKILGMPTPQTILIICHKYKIHWKKRKKTGERHLVYSGKATDKARKLVETLLAQTRNCNETARRLGLDVGLLRRKFPDLVEKYKRKGKINDLELVDRIWAWASMGVPKRIIALKLKMSLTVMDQICNKHKIVCRTSTRNWSSRNGSRIVFD